MLSFSANLSVRDLKTSTLYPLVRAHCKVHVRVHWYMSSAFLPASHAQLFASSSRPLAAGFVPFLFKFHPVVGCEALEGKDLKTFFWEWKFNWVSIA